MNTLRRLLVPITLGLALSLAGCFVQNVDAIYTYGVRGVAVDAGTGQPLANASVRVLPDPGPEFVSPAQSDADVQSLLDQFGVTVTTDANGQFDAVWGTGPVCGGTVVAPLGIVGGAPCGDPPAVQRVFLRVRAGQQSGTLTVVPSAGQQSFSGLDRSVDLGRVAFDLK